MNDDFTNEIDAINSIYGSSTIGASPGSNTYILAIPDNAISIQLQFSPDYPNAPPSVLGTETSGEHTKKGYASHILKIVRDTLATIYQPGQVCLFDLLEETRGRLADIAQQSEESRSPIDTRSVETDDNVALDGIAPEQSPCEPLHDNPPWTISSVVTEKKSVFIARSAPVTSPTQAQAYLDHLIATDKKVAKATHNITAWRIQSDSNPEVLFQDCDDDGETAAGGRLLHLMQAMNVWGVMVVVSRWYGGVQLGPDRWVH